MNNPYFETRFFYDSKKEKIWEVLSKYFQKYVQENNIVLDAGAGYCFFINHIKCKEKHAIDVDEIILKYANKDVKPKVGDIQNSTYRDDFFDVIFASNLLEHLSIEEILKTLTEFYRILKPGGKLLILSPNFKLCMKDYFDDYTHKSILTDKNIIDLLNSAGFELEVIKKRFLPFSASSGLPASTLLLNIYLAMPWKPFAGQMFAVGKKHE